MQQHLTTLIVILSVSAFLYGCSKSETGKPEPTDQRSGTSASHEAGTKSPERPGMKPATIRLEGMEQTFNLMLFDGSRGPYSLPFTTYIPEDLTTESMTSGEGDAVRFIANFDGERNDDASLEAFFYPAGINEARARELAKPVATSRGLRERRADAPKRYQWSLAEYDFSYQKDKGWIMGTVALGRHGNRFFRILLQYPENDSEGFAPRAERILAEWRWEDTGQGL